MNKKFIWLIVVIIILVSAGIYFAHVTLRPQPQIDKVFIFNPPLKIGVYEIEFLEGMERLRLLESRNVKNYQEILETLSAILPTSEKLAQGDELGKWWIKDINIQNSAAWVYFGGDTEFITERSGSLGARLIAAQITLALTEDERIKKIFLVINEGSHLGPGPYTRDNFKNLLPPDEYYGSSTYGSCQVNNDCFVSGCNSEICQSRVEEPLYSICIFPQKPIPSQLNYQCQCVTQRCQWAK